MSRTHQRLERPSSTLISIFERQARHRRHRETSVSKIEIRARPRVTGYNFTGRREHVVRWINISAASLTSS